LGFVARSRWENLPVAEASTFEGNIVTGYQHVVRAIGGTERWSVGASEPTRFGGGYGEATATVGSSGTSSIEREVSDCGTTKPVWRGGGPGRQRFGGV